MHLMESLMKLFFEWEIQLLVLFSFTLQLFLFFTGSLRRHNTSGFLRLSIWIAYLGADLVAVYALGYLSRYDNITIEKHIIRRTESLAFFWAPFLLIHLGGQDTITAFAMEDNNLWLRHLMNLVTQVVLALYVFWKSIGRHSVYLLVSGIFAFIAGIIKYVERIWSLNCGSLKNFESSTGDHYKRQMPKEIYGDGGYSSIVCVALRSMPYVLGIFSARTLFDNSPLSGDTLGDLNKTLEVVRLELGMIYEDLYTKALLLRTRSVIILRCISQISAIVAFALFCANNKQRYGKADIAITYALFSGVFFLDFCAIFISMMSPWTWAWLKARKCNRIAQLSWFVLSSHIGWPEKKQRWPKSMGQYSFRSWLAAGSYQPRTCSQRVMAMVRWTTNLFGVEKKKIFWLSKLLDTWQVDVGMMMIEYVAKEVSLLRDEFYLGPRRKAPREWPKLGILLERTQASLVADFGQAISFMHKLTEVHLSKYPPTSDMESDAASEDVIPLGIVEICRKLSNYMMYLLVTNPSMLPLLTSAAATLESSQQPQMINLLTLEETLDEFGLVPSKDTLEELVNLWIRLLIYAAGKSRAEMHSAQLSRGGELLTFTWLLMAHYGIGDSQIRRIRITNDDTTGTSDVMEVYTFYVPSPNHQLPVPPVEAVSSYSDVDSIDGTTSILASSPIWRSPRDVFHQ